LADWIFPIRIVVVARQDCFLSPRGYLILETLAELQILAEFLQKDSWESRSTPTQVDLSLIPVSTLLQDRDFVNTFQGSFCIIHSRKSSSREIQVCQDEAELYEAIHLVLRGLGRVHHVLFICPNESFLHVEDYLRSWNSERTRTEREC
jgi:hypothetical protein